jgi:hypothetical protein
MSAVEDLELPENDSEDIFVREKWAVEGMVMDLVKVWL